MENRQKEGRKFTENKIACIYQNPYNTRILRNKE